MNLERERNKVEINNQTTDVAFSGAVTDAPPAAAPEAFRPQMSAAEIHQLAALCEIVKMPEALFGFLKRNVSFDQARAELIDQRAADSGPEISSIFTGEAGHESIWRRCRPASEGRWTTG